MNICEPSNRSLISGIKKHQRLFVNCKMYVCQIYLMENPTDTSGFLFYFCGNTSPRSRLKKSQRTNRAILIHQPLGWSIALSLRRARSWPFLWEGWSRFLVKRAFYRSFVGFRRGDTLQWRRATKHYWIHLTKYLRSLTYSGQKWRGDFTFAIIKNTWFAGEKQSKKCLACT